MNSSQPFIYNQSSPLKLDLERRMIFLIGSDQPLPVMTFDGVKCDTKAIIAAWLISCYAQEAKEINGVEEVILIRDDIVTECL